MQTINFTNHIKLDMRTCGQPNSPTPSARYEDMQTTNLTNTIKLDLKTCRQVFPNCEDMQTTN